jgi:hypothetical protein
MKVHQIVCPNCRASLTSKAGIEEGASIPCPKCKAKFAVSASKKVEEVYEEFDVVDDVEEESPKRKAAAAPTRPAVKNVAAEDDGERHSTKKRARDEDDEPTPPRGVARKNKRADEGDEEEAPKTKRTRVTSDDEEDEGPRNRRKGRDEDDNEDEAPRSRKRARDEDEDDDAPRSRRRGRDDDEDDDRPRRQRRDDDDDEPKSGYAKLKSNPWVRGGVLALLLAIMGVLGWLLYEKRFKKDSSSDSSSNSKNDDDNQAPKDLRPPKIVLPKDVGSKKDTPAGKIDQRIVGKWRFPPAGVGKQDSYISIEYRANGTFEEDYSMPEGNGRNSGAYRTEPIPGNPSAVLVRRGQEALEVRFDFPGEIAHQLNINGKKSSFALGRAN